jgi:hypothetical protein
VDEGDFWLSLEYRVCREFAGLNDRFLRHLWCDGFLPKRYLLDHSEPRITGWAWICNGAAQHQWQFTLFLPHPVRSSDEVDWASLLPPENVTRWLALDAPGKRIQIEPSASVPDLV